MSPNALFIDADGFRQGMTYAYRLPEGAYGAPGMIAINDVPMRAADCVITGERTLPEGWHVIKPDGVAFTVALPESSSVLRLISRLTGRSVEVSADE